MSASRIPQLPAEVPQVRSRWRRWVGLIGLALGGWRVEGNLPNLRKFVLIVAPHTSNWDFPLGVLAKWAMGIEAKAYDGIVLPRSTEKAGM